MGLAVVMVGCGGGLLPVWAMTDASMIETTIVESELAGAPTVVTRLEREEQLGSYAGDIPASIILRVDAACNVVYAAQGADVRLTMVDGDVLYCDGEYRTIDIEKVKAEAQRHTDAILRSL